MAMAKNMGRSAPLTSPRTKIWGETASKPPLHPFSLAFPVKKRPNIFHFRPFFLAFHPLFLAFQTARPIFLAFKPLIFGL